MINNLHDFILYIWDFYGSDGLYPIEGLQKQHIFDAFEIYKERLQKGDLEYAHYSWGYGDSLDRERMREIILEFNLNKMEVV
tara:strand:+ start:1182 stop:1427 length:246 start_codon:yes stop_codon:yes gene_type:complete